jgi:hypothetical protein
MTSVLNVDTIADKAGTGPVGLLKASAQKAYISYNFDAIGIDNSLNMSSITDNGTGDCGVTMASAFENKFIVIAVSAGDAGTGDSGLFSVTIQDETTERTSSTFRAQMAFVSSSANKTVANKTYQNASVNGDLA